MKKLLLAAGLFLTTLGPLSAQTVTPAFFCPTIITPNFTAPLPLPQSFARIFGTVSSTSGAYFGLTNWRDITTATGTSAQFTGSVAGTALTVISGLTGTIHVGDYFGAMSTNGSVLPAGVTIVSGSGTSWVLSANLGTIASETMGTYTYNLSALDSVIAAMEARGIFAGEQTFAYVPGWANNGGASGSIPNSGGAAAAQFQTWLGQFLQYASALSLHMQTAHPEFAITYGAWNEADGGQFWVPTSSDTNGNKAVGASLAALVAALPAAIHANQPAAAIIAPSVVNPLNMLNWMDSFQAAGLDQYVTAYPFHAYPNANYATNASTGVLQLYQNLLNILEGYGVTKPIWWDEGGYGNGSAGILDTPTQTEYAAALNVMAASAGVPHWCWYAADATPTNAGSWGGALLNLLAGRYSKLNQQGRAYAESQKWLMGAPLGGWSTPFARVALANAIPNPTATGASAPNTLPTGWTASIALGTADHGVTTTISAPTTDPVDGTAVLPFNVVGTPTTGSGLQERIGLNPNAGLSPAMSAVVAGQIVTVKACVKLASGSSSSGLGSTPLSLGVNFYTSAYAGLGTLTSFNLAMFPYSPPGVSTQCYTASGVVPATATWAQPFFNINFAAVGTAINAKIYVATTASSPSLDAGGVWQGVFTKAGGQQQLIVMDETGTNPAYTVPPGCTQIHDVYGASMSVPYPGYSVSLGQLPLMLDMTANAGFQPLGAAPY